MPGPGVIFKVADIHYLAGENETGTHEIVHIFIKVVHELSPGGYQDFRVVHHRLEVGPVIIRRVMARRQHYRHTVGLLTPRYFHHAGDPLEVELLRFSVPEFYAGAVKVILHPFIALLFSGHPGPFFFHFHSLL